MMGEGRSGFDMVAAVRLGLVMVAALPASTSR